MDINGQKSFCSRIFILQNSTAGMHLVKWAIPWWTLGCKTLHPMWMKPRGIKRIKNAYSFFTLCVLLNILCSQTGAWLVQRACPTTLCPRRLGLKPQVSRKPFTQLGYVHSKFSAHCPCLSLMLITSCVLLASGPDVDWNHILLDPKHFYLCIC